MAKRTKLAFRCFLEPRTSYATLKSVSLQPKKIYDWRGIQIGTFSHINRTKTHVHFSDMCRHATFYMQSCCLEAYQVYFSIFCNPMHFYWSRHGTSFMQSCHLCQNVLTGFVIFSSTEFNWRDFEVWFIAMWKIYDWSGIQIYIKNLRLPFDSNRNIFTLQSHTNTCAFLRTVQTRHFLHAVVPPGGKTYQTGFVIFSITDFNLYYLEVCFIST